MDTITHQHLVMPTSKPDKSAQSGKVSEYIIYTYKHYDDEKFGFNKWYRYKTISGLNRAIKEAKVLHRSQKFQKIEVKQKYFDKNANKTFSKTLKVFQKGSFGWNKLAVLVAVSVVLLAVILTVLL